MTRFVARSTKLRIVTDGDRLAEIKARFHEMPDLVTVKDVAWLLDTLSTESERLRAIEQAAAQLVGLADGYRWNPTSEHERRTAEAVEALRQALGSDNCGKI